MGSPIENKTQIRLASYDDAPVIADFTRTMANETEGLSLNANVVLKGVRSFLNNPHYGFYIVAVHEQQTVGCLMITYEWSDWRDGVQWWLQSVYVRPEFRRMGVFHSMYKFVHGKAVLAKNVCGIRLYVDKDNKIAQNTYLALGMEPANYLVYELSL